jgi:hypothetical protein
MKNEQTDDQEPNADQDLEAAFLGLEANLAGARSLTGNSRLVRAGQ